VVKAEQGHAYSQYLLGYSYYLGRDVPQSYKKAVFWYKKEHSIW
jgi:TPR repeat protein